MTAASVTSGGRSLGTIGPGLLVLVGVTHSDDVTVAARLAAKVTKLRIFADDSGKMNLSVRDVGGSVLAVSQFTLYGEVWGGNRPSYGRAARPEIAAPLFDAFVTELRDAGVPVETGEFGADMRVELVNDGPVTLWIEAEP